MNEFLVTLSSLVAIVVSAGSLYIALKKMPVDSENTEADTAAKYQDLADKAAERALKLDKRVAELEESNVKKDRDIAELRREYAELKQENADLRDWAERLTYQVQSVGLMPVKMKVKPNER